MAVLDYSLNSNNMRIKSAYLTNSASYLQYD